MRPQRRQLTRLLHLWDSPSKNTRVGCHALLQGIFPTESTSPVSPALAGGFFTTSATWEALSGCVIALITERTRKPIYGLVQSICWAEGKSLFPGFLLLGGTSIWNMLWLLCGPPSTPSEQTGRKMWGVGCPFPAQELPCCCWLGWVFPREGMRWGLLLSLLSPSLLSMRQAMGPEITRRAG